MSGTSAKIMGFLAEVTCAEIEEHKEAAKISAKPKYNLFIR
jgi:hypothetical protein